MKEIKRKDLIFFIFNLFIILSISIVWIINSSVICIEYKATSNGTIQLFYQDKEEAIYSESKTIIKTIIPTEKKERARFYIPINDIKKIRIDIDKADGIIITNIYYNLGILSYKKVDITNLNILIHDAWIKNIQEGISWERTGNDSWISIGIDNFYLLKGRLIFSSFILFIIMLSITYLFTFMLIKRKKNRLKKIIKLLFLTIIFLIMIFVTRRSFYIISHVKEITYQVRTNNCFTREIKKELEEKFITKGKKTLQYNIFIETITGEKTENHGK